MPGTIAHPDATNRVQRRHPNVPVFLDREEAALSLRVSVSTLDRLIRAGRLRAPRIGRRVVVSPQAIDHSAARSRRPSGARRREKDSPRSCLPAPLRAGLMTAAEPTNAELSRDLQAMRAELAELRAQLLCIRCSTPPPPPERWPGDPWSHDTRPGHTCVKPARDP